MSDYMYTSEEWRQGVYLYFLLIYKPRVVQRHPGPVWSNHCSTTNPLWVVNTRLQFQVGRYEGSSVHDQVRKEAFEKKLGSLLQNGQMSCVLKVVALAGTSVYLIICK